MTAKQRTDIVIIFTALFVAGTFGYLEGKHAADRWYAQHTLKLEGITDDGLGTTATRALSPSPSNYLADGLFCSQDGVNWWHARNDGSCWASDKPSVTLIRPIKVKQYCFVTEGSNWNGPTPEVKQCIDLPARAPEPVASIEEPR